ncbi:MAG TPA: cell surface protein SprA, partial [Pirellula sp.]|nr:cell surface protein SprA [Pirellula sp.]
WRNILKNSYYIGGAGFDEKDFSARVISTQPTGQQVELMRSSDGFQKAISVLGLDRVTNSDPSIRRPDGLVDVGTGLQNFNFIVDKKTGTITFPYLEPFGRRIQDFYAVEQRRNRNVKFDTTFFFPDLYRNSQEVIRIGGQFFKNNQISINIKFAGGVSSTINLNAFNIVDGSVRVNIPSRQLVENTDYRVDYNSGTVSLLRPDLINAGPITVDYETHDIFTNATKTVLGFRAEMPLLDKGVIGSSLMNYGMRLPSLKTRQGEEPLSNWILGLDGNYNVPVPFVTDFLNYLPFFNLKEKSNLSFRTDMALSLPNPNTQSSTIPFDNEKSIAYLDDFEGGKNEFRLTTSAIKWSPSSQPVYDPYSLYTATERDSIVNSLKSRIFWNEAQVESREIKPARDVVSSNSTMTVMDVQFDPDIPGIYNVYPTTTGDPSDHWGGFMIYSQGLNINATNTDAIEFWMKIEQDGGNPNGFLRFDMG